MPVESSMRPKRGRRGLVLLVVVDQRKSDHLRRVKGDLGGKPLVGSGLLVPPLSPSAFKHSSPGDKSELGDSEIQKCAGLRSTGSGHELYIIVSRHEGNPRNINILRVSG